MSLHADIHEDEFSEEMTHRVVRYGARSPESREGLRFAKRHPNSKLLKIARFKIAEQERFDIENGLASSWVRTLHFLDEEVFDRLRLNSIGQVVAVTSLVLGILFLSDRARSWSTPAKAPRGPSDQALMAAAETSPSPVDEWLRKKLADAIESPDFQDRLKTRLGEAVVVRPPDLQDTAARITAALIAPEAVATAEKSIPPLSPATGEQLLLELEQQLSQAPLEAGAMAALRSILDNPAQRQLCGQALERAARRSCPAPDLAAILPDWIRSPVIQEALRKSLAVETTVSTAADP